MKIPNYKSRN